MTTAQQLGLVGNSVRVQALPTASAETFGQGNRYYTLIGQQEGYITGHTYHTIVANDVYSWEDVAGGASDYNVLTNIPVINQDLTAAGFTPVANTYYRHTGTTTDTFTQGVIYLYDTAYHKLGESGGGTKLNMYNYTLSPLSNKTENLRLIRILTQAKGRIYGSASYQVEYYVNAYYAYIITTDYEPQSKTITTKKYGFSVSDGAYSSGSLMMQNMETGIYQISTITAKDGIVQITYFNDTEIT